MTIRDDRREAAIERMGDFILSHGLAAATLRPLAAAAGVSDRMLLYYFTDKDDLLVATLDRVATRMIAHLDEAIPLAFPRAFAVLLQQVWAAMARDSLRPFMPLWLELASGAARGQQPHRDVAGRIADGFLAWVTARLPPETGGGPNALAPLFLAAIEGMSLLRAVGRADLADSTVTALAPRF